MHCLLNRHFGQSGHRACTCPLNRQGTAEAAHPHACFRKCYSSIAPCTPLQHLWGSKTHTGVPAHTHVHAHTHAHTHAHGHTHTYKHKRTRVYTQSRTHTYTSTRTNTQTHMRAHIHTHKHTGTHPHTQIHTRILARTHTDTLTHMHMHAHVARVMGFANFLASLATLPHLSLVSIDVCEACIIKQPLQASAQFH